MKATILDTQTGVTAIAEGPRSWEWAENNWSCDCNRNYFGHEKEDTGVCLGSHRYLVIAAEFNDPEDYEYTLRELNEHYPEELLNLHLP